MISELREVPARLLRALHAAPVIPEDRINAYIAAGGRSEAVSLNRYELAILRYLSRGLTSAQAADAVGEPFQTVKHRLRSARYKLGSKTTTQACCEAVRRGLIP